VRIRDEVRVFCVNGILRGGLVECGTTTFDANSSPGTLLREVLPFAYASALPMRSDTRLVVMPLLFG